MKNYKVLFESDRLYYIKLNFDLINDYLIMMNDKKVRKFISEKTYGEVSHDQEYEWVNKKLIDNNIIFSIIEKETDQFVGNIELMHIRNNIGELGIALTSNKQNNHYGLEAINAFIQYINKNHIVKDIELNVFNFNKRAIHCYEKAGFVKNGKGKTGKDIHMIYSNQNKERK